MKKFFNSYMTLVPMISTSNNMCENVRNSSKGTNTYDRTWLSLSTLQQIEELAAFVLGIHYITDQITLQIDVRPHILVRILSNLQRFEFYMVVDAKLSI